MDLNQLLDIATGAARAAGDLLIEHFGENPTGVATKSSPTDLVSDADHAADELLQSLISGRRPDDGLVTEESEGRESGSGVSWVLDPLDGTVNFLFGIPWWSVSVAAEDDSGVLVGAIYNPVMGEMFSAARGRGAHLDGMEIHVGDRSDLAHAMIGTGFSYDAEIRAHQAAVVTEVLPRARDIRRAGSAALDLCSLACGRLDGFYEAPMEHWDKAAGILIVEEADGVVTDLPAPGGRSPGVIAANAMLHPKLSELVLR